MPQISRVSISSVILGELVDKALFIPLVIGLVLTIDTATALFSALALVLGSLCTLTGAFFAANRAKRLFVTHALLVAALAFGISFVRFLLVHFSEEPSVHPLWWEFVSWGVTFLVGYVGGVLARLKTQSSSS